jgi:lysosomal Pro-X carboxypeptidase
MKRNILALATLASACSAAQVWGDDHPTAANCTTKWFAQRVDHFSWKMPSSGNMSWAQRYLVCDQYFDPANGIILFYNGNEGDVTLYANNTGLMWENAQEFGALLVFAEHRYYGQSMPVPDPTDMSYLSSAQALADYAVLIRAIKESLGPQGMALPVVTVGGSYGGVLAALFRSKYPGTVDGAIAASAPLRAFPGQSPPWDTSSYYSVISRDASSAGGTSDKCAANIKAMWPMLFADGATVSGRARLSTIFQTCTPLQSADDALALAFFIRGTFDTMSMGNYPYPSSYMTGGAVVLPAFPVREACSFLSTPIDPVGNTTGLYAAVMQAIGVFNNATPTACYDTGANPYTHPATQYDGIWDYQRCTELQPDSFWFATNGQTDMFWEQPYDLNFTTQHCTAAWNVTEPSYEWITTGYGLPDFAGVSNILFTNGLYDPWGAAGIQISPAPERDLVVFNVTEGAHHLDLFFSNPADPPSVTEVRQQQVSYIRKWVTQARKDRQARRAAREAAEL